MARIVKGTGVVFPEIKKIRELLKDYPKSIRRKYMKAAFNAAAKVGATKLKSIVPKGPTGNLRRSVTTKATQNYGLAGFRASRKSDTKAKGFHQGFLEFGTKDRVIKVPSSSGVFIASSFERKKFKLSRKALVKGGRKVVQATPKYPKSFFKAAPFGQKLVLPPMPVGGRLGTPPVKTAFTSSRSQITSVLKQQMSTVLERANKDMARRAKAT
jgi:hypothetical protein